jgi:hypothetical protein
MSVKRHCSEPVRAVRASNSFAKAGGIKKKVSSTNFLAIREAGGIRE